eukprot:scaffold168695_cov18-Prasinocladus_malaysianus.AAC.1
MHVVSTNVARLLTTIIGPRSFVCEVPSDNMDGAAKQKQLQAETEAADEIERQQLELLQARRRQQEEHRY